MTKTNNHIPRSIHRYREDIDSFIGSFVQRNDGTLYEMIKYHLGYDGENGQLMGKAIRPALCLFTTEALGGEPKRALPAAASLELIHNFSLVHDDVQDDAELRRGRKSVQAKWNPNQAINTGDGLKDLSVIILTRFNEKNSPELISETLALLSEYSLRMIEGQVLDLLYMDRNRINTEEYLCMIEQKTCALLESAFHIGGLYAGARDEVSKLSQLGKHLGYVYQIRDDWLGIWGQPDKFGKSVHSDLTEMKKSFPVVFGLENASGTEGKNLIELYRTEDSLSKSQADRVRHTLENLGAKRGTQQLAEKHWNKAKSILKDLPFSEKSESDMFAFGDFLLHREQ